MDGIETPQLAARVKQCLGDTSKRLDEVYLAFLHSNQQLTASSDNPTIKFSLATQFYRVVRHRHGDEYTCGAAEFFLYRTFISPEDDDGAHGGIEANPFLYHVLGQYHYPRAFAMVKTVLGYILNSKGGELGQLSLDEVAKIGGTGVHEAAPPSDDIDRDRIQQALLKQGIDQPDIDRLLQVNGGDDGSIGIEARDELQSLHESAETDTTDSSGDGGDGVATRISRIVDNLVTIDSAVVGAVRSKGCNWVTTTCYDAIISGRPEFKSVVLAEGVSWLPATNYAVDYVFRLVTNSERISYDERRLVVHNFIAFNIENHSDLGLQQIGLLGVFVLSLHSRHLLRPTQEYRSMYSLFMPWMGHVPEAKRVYLLGQD